jgi:hypothetical protein
MTVLSIKSTKHIKGTQRRENSDIFLKNSYEYSSGHGLAVLCDLSIFREKRGFLYSPFQSSAELSVNLSAFLCAKNFDYYDFHAKCAEAG